MLYHSVNIYNTISVNTHTIIWEIGMDLFYNNGGKEISCIFNFLSLLAGRKFNLKNTFECFSSLLRLYKSSRSLKVMKL